MADEDDKQDQAAFGEGFNGDTPPQRAETAQESQPQPAETKPAEATPATETPPVKAAEPEYVRITKEQFEKLSAAADSVTEMRQRLDKAHGTIGNVQQTVREMQTALAKGKRIKVRSDAFAAMQEEYPDLTDKWLKSMEAGLELSDAEPEQPKPDPAKTGGQTLTPEDVKRLASEERAKLELESLTDAYPDWAEIVGAVDIRAGQKPDPNHPFRAWLATQPEDYRRRVEETQSAQVIQRAIEKFQAAAKRPSAQTETKPAATRTPIKERAAAAATPRSAGGSPPPNNSLADAFASGFSEG